VPAGAHRVRFVFRPFHGVMRETTQNALAALDALVALIRKGVGAGDKKDGA
jgi:hypothetical protein